jgi:hypothetical protein
MALTIGGRFLPEGAEALMRLVGIFFSWRKAEGELQASLNMKDPNGEVGSGLNRRFFVVVRLHRPLRISLA